MTVFELVMTIIGTASGSVSILTGAGMTLFLMEGDSMDEIPISRTATFMGSLIALLCLGSAALSASAVAWEITGALLLTLAATAHTTAYRKLSPARQKKLLTRASESRASLLRSMLKKSYSLPLNNG